MFVAESPSGNQSPWHGIRSFCPVPLSATIPFASVEGAASRVIARSDLACSILCFYALMAVGPFWLRALHRTSGDRAKSAALIAGARAACRSPAFVACIRFLSEARIVTPELNHDAELRAPLCAGVAGARPVHATRQRLPRMSRSSALTRRASVGCRMLRSAAALSRHSGNTLVSCCAACVGSLHRHTRSRFGADR